MGKTWHNINERTVSEIKSKEKCLRILVNNFVIPASEKYSKSKLMDGTECNLSKKWEPTHAKEHQVQVADNLILNDARIFSQFAVKPW